jgi:DNA-binding transcriptional regulator YiaG
MVISDVLENQKLASSIKFEVSAKDLLDFANEIISQSFEKGKELAQIEKKAETYLTPSEFAERLGISLVTLWNWDKKGITNPLRVGNTKRYRESDLEKILVEINEED